MVHPVEKVALGVWKIGNRAAWTGLKMTKMDSLMAQLLCAVVPSRYEAFCLDMQESRKREREEQIVRDLGLVTTHAFRGNIPIDYRELDPVWEQVKRGKCGVEFEDVHDPHTAILLHNITPCVQDGASTEEVKQL